MGNDIRQQKVDASLESIDIAKRETLRRMAFGAAYAVPVVASFAIDGLTVSPALAGLGNLTLS